MLPRQGKECARGPVPLPAVPGWWRERNWSIYSNHAIPVCSDSRMQTMQDLFLDRTVAVAYCVTQYAKVFCAVDIRDALCISRLLGWLHVVVPVDATGQPSPNVPINTLPCLYDFGRMNGHPPRLIKHQQVTSSCEVTPMAVSRRSEDRHWREGCLECGSSYCAPS
jgi:hypothetical protein